MIYVIIYILISFLFFYLSGKIEKDVSFLRKTIISVFWLPLLLIIIGDALWLVVSGWFIRENDEIDDFEEKEDKNANE